MSVKMQEEDAVRCLGEVRLQGGHKATAVEAFKDLLVAGVTEQLKRRKFTVMPRTLPNGHRALRVPVAEFCEGVPFDAVVDINDSRVPQIVRLLDTDEDDAGQDDIPIGTPSVKEEEVPKYVPPQLDEETASSLAAELEESSGAPAAQVVGTRPSPAPRVPRINIMFPALVRWPGSEEDIHPTVENDEKVMLLLREKDSSSWYERMIENEEELEGFIRELVACGVPTHSIEVWTNCIRPRVKVEFEIA